MKPIAVVIYMTENNDLYHKYLYSDDEVDAVRNGEDDCVNEQKSIIVKHDFAVEDHT